MKIFEAGGKSVETAIIPGDFTAFPGHTDSLLISSPAVEREISETLCLQFYGPLTLIVPFYDEQDGFLFIAAQIRRRRLTDLFKRSDDLYGILPVQMSEKELNMLYTLLYPGKAPDTSAVSAVLKRQAEVLTAFFQKNI